MDDPVSNIASSLAAYMIQQRLDEGDILEIPSLNTYIAGRGRMKASEVEAKLAQWGIEVDMIRTPIVALVERAVKAEAELERLQRIEQAARAHKAAWDDGTNSTMAHDTRQALWAALEGE